MRLLTLFTSKGTAFVSFLVSKLRIFDDYMSDIASRGNVYK